MGFFDLFKRKKEEPKPQEVETIVAAEADETVTTDEAEETTEVDEIEEVEEVNIEAERKELEAGLERTKEGFFGRLKRAIAGRTTVDADVLDDLEEVLITSDVGVETTVKIIEAIEARVAKDKYMNTSELHAILRDEIAKLMEESHRSTEDFGIEVKEGLPYVMMVVGVNGAGKTTAFLQAPALDIAQGQEGGPAAAGALQVGNGGLAVGFGAHHDVLHGTECECKGIHLTGSICMRSA